MTKRFAKLSVKWFSATILITIVCQIIFDYQLIVGTLIGLLSFASFIVFFARKEFK